MESGLVGGLQGVGRPPTGVPKLVLGGPVKLGGLPTKTCTRTVSPYINNVHVGPYQWRADWLGASKGVGRPQHQLRNTRWGAL